MRRDVFTADHEAFRKLARDFIEKRVVPDYPIWEKAGRMPRAVFEQLGSLGLLGTAIPEEFGERGCPTTATTSSCRRRRPALWSR